MGFDSWRERESGEVEKKMPPSLKNKEIWAENERDLKQLSIGRCSSFKSCWNNIIKGNKQGIYDLPAGNSLLHLSCGVNTVCKAGGIGVCLGHTHAMALSPASRPIFICSPAPQPSEPPYLWVWHFCVLKTQFCSVWLVSPRRFDAISGSRLEF